MVRVVVTGLGVVSPLGQSFDEFAESLRAARSGIVPVPPSLYNGGHPLVAGVVPFDAADRWTPYQAALYDRATQFALVAAEQALASAPTGNERSQIGVYWGTGLGGAMTIEESYRLYYLEGGRMRPASVVTGMSNAAAGNVSMTNGLRGPILNVSTACSSSAAAIGEAFRAIKHGYADAMVAGGSEALINNTSLRAWDAMQALAHADPIDASRSCKPFAADRKGFVLGEGAGALLLEREDYAIARGARIIAELVGYGNRADATHISRPDPDGQAGAMRAALVEAGLEPRAVGYINAHGTATPVGDVAETTAIKMVFGAEAPPVSSTKALHGHLMGATGVVELIAALVALERGFLPPTAHLDVPDPACDLDYIPNVARDASLDTVMSNSFGFGGMNAVLIARRHTGST
jgi:3-oxoacyl-(acyl-carrier-protein) synthase